MDFAASHSPAAHRRFDLVIFDCDGVLVESEELACRLFVDLMREHGHELDFDDVIRRFHGRTIEDRLAMTERALGWTRPDDFVRTFAERERAASESELRTVAGVHELIASITDIPLPMCVASNGVRDETLMRLRIAGLADRFGDAVFSGVDVARPKPAPDVYLAAAEAFGVAPSRCVVIEDSVTGVTAAAAAGMTVYGHATFSSADELRAAGAIPFSSMPEVQAILSRDLAGAPVG